MGQAQWISEGRGRILNGARPKWVMVGLEWDGPGVLLMASDRLSAARLDFEARRHDLRDMADLRADLRPSLALTTVIATRPAGGLRGGYLLSPAPGSAQAHAAPV